jgi:Peptidase family S41/Ricin-type beta-trefoil lectin domain-like
MMKHAIGRRSLVGLSLALAMLIAIPASAQLTVEQKVQDFENLAGLFAKRYAPYEWKRDFLGFDLLQIAPWLDRVARSTDDLEFFEIALEYVASLDDTHTSYSMPSSFIADLGFTVDIFDDRVLIDSINRSRLTLPQYPFQIGDELISVDGIPVETLMTDFSRFLKRANPVATRRTAADFLTRRPQSRIPRAIDLADQAIVVIARAGGAQETFSIAWLKTGVPLRFIGPVTSPSTSSLFATTGQGQDVPSYYEPWLELTNFRLPENDPLLSGETVSPTGEVVPRRFVLGLGLRTPVFVGGLPANFVQRLGGTSTDFHFSGTYEADGARIGYLRIPNFAPPNTLNAVAELANEIAYLQQNTDGLVVDVMRNTGGGCYMLTAASYLIAHPFFFFGEEVRVTIDRINAFQTALENAIRLNAPASIIQIYQQIVSELQTAYNEGRQRTSPLPACSLQLFGNEPARDAQGNILAYTKPLIVLVDEFSISAGDIFPAMLQDNQRGPLVGTRTNGAGGSVSGWPAGVYSEAITGNTNTLVTRIAPVHVPGYPVAPYIENIGAHADIPLNYMTRTNLMTGGRPFVEAFTGVILDEIRGRYFEIVSRNSGKCLDVFGASLDDAAPVIQWTCTGGPNQQWRLESGPSGAYRLVARHSGKALDVFGALIDDLTPAIQFPANNGDNQLWTLQPASDGYVSIVARHSGKPLDVAGASVDDGAPVIQYTANGGANQQWQLREVPR